MPRQLHSLSSLYASHMGCRVFERFVMKQVAQYIVLGSEAVQCGQQLSKTSAFLHSSSVVVKVEHSAVDLADSSDSNNMASSL